MLQTFQVNAWTPLIDATIKNGCTQRKHNVIGQIVDTTLSESGKLTCLDDDHILIVHAQ